MQKIKILIADDHRLFLDGIVSLLQNEPAFDVVATAENGQQVINLLEHNTYDVCILDINMSPVNGMEAARYIREHRPQVKTIVLSTYNDKAFITEMLLAGVAGYVLKNATRAEMVDAIHTVMRGKTYFSKEVHENIVSDYVNRVKEKKDQSQENEATLTQRETEIVKLLANEYTNEQIATALNISYRTVETHRKNIMHKTKAQNLAGLIKYAFSKGII